MTEEKTKRTRSNRYQHTEIEEPKQKKIIPKEKEEKKEIPPLLKKIIIITIISLLLIFFYSTFIGTKIIDIKESKIESNILPDSFHGLKIVQLSDIHYGTSINKKQLTKIVTKVNNLKPDIIVFTGDLIDKNISLTEESINDIIEVLNTLESSYKYAIQGDEDLNNKEYKNIIEKTNFKLLENESTLLYYKDTTPIVITGYNPIITSPNYTILTNLVDDQDTTNYFKLVLTHEPDSIDKFIKYNPNLILSGHTLGGIFKVPFINKPIFLPNNSKKYNKEYYKIENTDLFISDGLGTSGLNSRLFNHPEINLYRLYKTK